MGNFSKTENSGEKNGGLLGSVLKCLTSMWDPGLSPSSGAGESIEQMNEDPFQFLFETGSGVAMAAGRP